MLVPVMAVPKFSILLKPCGVFAEKDCEATGLSMILVQAVHRISATHVVSDRLFIEKKDLVLKKDIGL